MVQVVKPLSHVAPFQARELYAGEPRPSQPAVKRAALMADSAGYCSSSAGLLLLAGEHSQALIVLKHCPNTLFVPFWSAFAYAGLGQREQALIELSRLPDSAVFLRNGGVEEHRRGNSAAAVWLMAKSLDLDRTRTQFSSNDRALLYQWLVEDYEQLGQRQLALDWARRWVEADPLNIRASTILAGILVWEGEYDQAFSTLQHIEALGGRKDVLFAGILGQIYQERGDWDAALAAYRESWQWAKDEEWARPSAAWYLGYALYHQGLIEESVAYLEIAAANGNQNARTVLQQIRQR